MVPAQGPYSIPHVLWNLSTMGHRIINYFWPFGAPDIILPVAFQCFFFCLLPWWLDQHSATDSEERSTDVQYFFCLQDYLLPTLTCKLLPSWPPKTPNSAQLMGTIRLYLQFHSLCCGLETLSNHKEKEGKGNGKQMAHINKCNKKIQTQPC